MAEEIINKVANSTLEVFDLESYYPNGDRVQLDISQWLLEGFILKEKDFRDQLKKHNWQQYNNAFVAINCSTDAIVPAWAYVLVASYLKNFAIKVVNGTILELNTSLYQDILKTIDFTVYNNKAVILKGCSKKPVPQNVYVLAIQELQKYAKSIMFGEACSAVPIYKSK